LWRRHPELEGELEEDAEYLDGDDEEWDFPQCGEDFRDIYEELG
jgi:hypothetical protein